MERDLTKGPVSQALMRFVWPFLGATILQFLYSVVDMIVVGRFADPAAISAVNTSGQLMQVVASLLTGVATGGTVLIGQYTGAGRREDAQKTIGATLVLLAGMGAGLTVLLLAGNHLIIRVMQVPAQAVAPARSYLYITSAGTLFIAGYNACSAVLRGLGDSKRPMYFIACSCILNILGDLLLVGGFQLGAAGAAYATVGAQGIACILSLWVLGRGDYRFSRKNLRPETGRTAAVLKLGVPLAAQDVLVALSFVLITAVVNAMGVSRSAAVGVVERIIGFGMLVPIAFMSALSAFTAQNVGAGLTDRARRGLKISLGLCVLLSGLLFAADELFPRALVGLFTTDEAVIENGVSYMRTYCIDVFLVALVFCFNGFFSGCGRTRFTMANCLLSTFAVRVPMVYLLSRMAGVTLLHIGIAAPVASVVQIVMQLVYYKRGSWQGSVIQNEP